MTKYSVKKPFTVLVGILLVMVLGVVSFFELNTDLLPAMDLPYVVVYTVYPGASPERVEVAVTQPLEGAVATTSGLENINSISAENMSLIIMEFSGSTNMDSAMIELSNNIDMVSGYLDDMVQSPVLMKINPDMLPVQMLSIDVDGMDIKQLSEYVETELSPRLERLDGVATVDASGLVSDHVDISLNQEKIDRVNDRILKAVNNELYKTKKDLDKAQQELTDGMNLMAAKEQDAYNQLAYVSAQLDAGQAQAQAIAAEKSKLEIQIQMYEQARQLVGPLSQMKTVDFALSAVIELGNQFPQLGISGATTLADIMNFTITLPEDTPEEIKPQLEAAIAQLAPSLDRLKSGVQGMIDQSAGALTADSTLADLQAFIQSATAQMTEGLKQMGIAQEIIDTGSTVLLDNKIATLKNELSRATLMATQMESTLQQLQATYAQVEAAKMQASSQLAAASVQMSSAQAQLDAGVAQFESARDEALRQANIDSLVTREMLSNILMAQNFSMPAGYISDGNDSITVKVGETFSSLEELENLLLVDMGMKGVDPIYLHSVADISISDNSADSYVRVNGNPGVSISIQKSSTASTSRVSALVNEEVAEIMAENPAVHITQLMDQGIFIEMVVNSVLSNMGYGGIIALFVLIFFLRDWKPTLIIGFSIPLSVLFTVVMMYFSGVNLNVMSLSGLALGIGMLVDNSIVVIENIYRLRNLGYSKIKAAVIGAQQVAGAIASSTLTTICVFVPIVFTDGLTRQLFTDMGLTIAFSLVASLVVALTVVPAMASVMLTKTKDYSEGMFGRLNTAYEKLMVWNLDHKWAVIVLTVGLLVFSGWKATSMPMTLIPAMDSTQMQMTLTMPGETPDEELIRHAEIIAERTQAVESVQTVGISMGGSGIAAMMGGSNDTKSMSFYVVLDEDKQLSNEEIADIIEEQNPEYAETLSVTANTMDLGALAGSGISVQIKGNDLDILQSEAVRMADLLRGVEGIEEVNDGSSAAVEEMRIEVNKTEAMKNGLTVAQVFRKVSSALTEETTATTLTFEGEDMDAVIHTASTYNKDTIGSLVVTTKTDDDGEEKEITLRDIATIGTATSPESINRSNQSRYMTVSATVSDGYNATLISRDIEDLLKDYKMPKGYSYAMTGEDETIMAAMFDMIKMIALAIVFIYLIMVAQFQSLKSPFIVMFTIPLAFTGGLLALFITNTELSIVAMIGFLVLAGVVVNNGIVFVDYVNSLRLGGMDKRSALLRTGKDRIRPILMTALTTILANSTMAMGVGMGAELSRGMAIVSIGGLAYATLLTLFLVPALYDIFNRGEMKRIDVDFEDEGL
ncbi:MAG: efflux RND transporter permease subunit [Oscillospiraceae bacterium]|nr:efflux RND transporter permease subunit [Oscillospiraceae bacterium]